MPDQEKIRQLLKEARLSGDCVALMKFARQWQRIAGEARSLLPQSRRLALLCSATSDTYAPLLEVCAAANGLALRVQATPYGTWQQQILEVESALHEFAPELALLHLTHRDLSQWPSLDATHDEAEQAAAGEAAEILEWCRKLHERHAIPVFLTNFHGPPVSGLGNLNARLAAAPDLHIARVNLALARHAPSWLVLVDVAGLASRFGVDRWFDPTAWHHAKQPLAYDAMPLFVQSFGALLASCCLASAKCVILDLDNTLWGGVVADDGLDGIRIGQGNAEGEAYQEFQRYLLGLRRRGVLLAVCSKNQDKLAREPFENHDQMLIKLPDLAAFVANFQPKADNVRAIARHLNLGVDSFVFVDDSPAEREQMRQLLPAIKVVDLPQDPSHFVAALERSLFFETPALTKEDLSRAVSYAANARRAELASKTSDIKEFLRSLEMRAALGCYEVPHLERITQLINKSNQFNLCTRRHTLAEVEAMARDAAWVTLWIRLQDRFGDHGLISAIHGCVKGEMLAIENWVMSCRVLDRGVEHLAVAQLARQAVERGCRTIHGLYLPTSKNALVRDHYRKLGFTLVHGKSDGTTTWHLNLASFSPPSHFIQTALPAP